MNPFNLLSALSGKPVTTRDGLRVTGLKRHSGEHHYPLTGILEGYGESRWTIDGCYVLDDPPGYGGPAGHDLFMKVEQLKLF